MKNVISRTAAIKISPDYVAFVEGDYEKWSIVNTQFEKVKKGQEAITFADGVFVKVKVTSVIYEDYRAVDGPIVRVGNDEYTWRVDGDKYAWILT